MGETTITQTALHQMQAVDSISTPATLTATIANGASLSDAVAVGNTFLTGLILPAAWTTANLTFQGSVDGSNFYNIYDVLGTEITVKAAVDRFVRMDPMEWSIFTHIKIRSGTAAEAVNQGAARTIKIVTRAF